MKMSKVDPYDTIQVAKIRKCNAAFHRAKRIVSRRRWKQEVGYPPMSNVRGE